MPETHEIPKKDANPWRIGLAKEGQGECLAKGCGGTIRQKKGGKNAGEIVCSNPMHDMFAPPV
ncbi:MAG: hypothetical protein AAB573_00555 [Patescibacteria group bacterium]